MVRRMAIQKLQGMLLKFVILEVINSDGIPDLKKKYVQGIL